MELIRDIIEWVASDTINFIATVFPYALLGLVGLYLLSLLVGYLRVSQVGLGEGHGGQVVALPGPSDDAGEPAQLGTAPRGVPYCPTDGLQYPVGAVFCARCER